MTEEPLKIPITGRLYTSRTDEEDPGPVDLPILISCDWEAVFIELADAEHTYLSLDLDSLARAVARSMASNPPDGRPIE